MGRQKKRAKRGSAKTSILVRVEVPQLRVVMFRLSNGRGYYSKGKPYPAFSSSIGNVRLCFFTISAVIVSSVIFLLPGT